MFVRLLSPSSFPCVSLLTSSVPSFAFTAAPSASEYPHAARWYSHIASWESEHSTLPGDAAAGAALFGGASASAPAASEEEEDEDEIDLFGSDDEEEVCLFYMFLVCFTVPLGFSLPLFQSSFPSSNYLQGPDLVLFRY